MSDEEFVKSIFSMITTVLIILILSVTCVKLERIKLESYEAEISKIKLQGKK